MFINHFDNYAQQKQRSRTFLTFLTRLSSHKIKRFIIHSQFIYYCRHTASNEKALNGQKRTENVILEALLILFLASLTITTTTQFFTPSTHVSNFECGMTNFLDCH